MTFANWKSVHDEMENLHRDLNQMFQGWGMGSWDWPVSRYAFLPGRASRAYPLFNLSEDNDNFYVQALAPGIDPQTLDIQALHNQVTIQGEKPGCGPKVTAESYHRCERSAGKFVRTVELPSQINPDGVRAQYQDGLLKITLPKAESAKPRQIGVQVA